MPLYDMTRVQRGRPDHEGFADQSEPYDVRCSGHPGANHLRLPCVTTSSSSTGSVSSSPRSSATSRVPPSYRLVVHRRDCRLVVVELKRTSDGGHMELQALRYAAMVSTMTFDQVVRAFAKYRKSRELRRPDEATARADLVTWLDDDTDEGPVVSARGRHRACV